MASIKFIIQNKSTEAQIYCRFSLGRGQVFKRKAGFMIDAKDWSDIKGYPIQRDAEQKSRKLKTSLENLSQQIIEQYNNDYQNGKEINSDWLKYTIDKYHNQDEARNLDLITEFAKKHISDLPYKIINGSMGVKDTTVKKYQTVLNKILAFEKYESKQFHIADICPLWGKRFIKYLVEVEHLSTGYVGRLIKFVKTFALEAQKEGILTNPNLSYLQGFTTKHDPKVLDFEELSALLSTRFANPKLENAKDWLIIGCYTGQRVSDLLRMSSKMIKILHGFEFIVITQEKTKKNVQIPLHPVVKHILTKRNGNFPDTFSPNHISNSTIFNRYLKTICKQAGINTLETGERFDQASKRKIKGTFEKWEFVSSHICRRSFATNFYAQEKYPTPLLMNITAHSSEKQFLEYIGKPPLDFSVQLAKIWANEPKPEMKKLRIIEI